MYQENKYFYFLKNPFVILLSIAIGIFLGINYPTLSRIIAPVGTIYINLLQMAVIPILVSAIISNIAKLANSNIVKVLLSRILIVFIVSVSVISIFGVMLGAIAKPGGGLTQEQKNTLGTYVDTYDSQSVLEISLSEPTTFQQQDGLLDFIVKVVPENVFDSLSTGNTIELVFFCIILGVAIWADSRLYRRKLSSTFQPPPFWHFKTSSTG